LKGFGLPSLNEAILHVDTTSFTDLNLSFDQKEFGDADDPMPETFTDSVDADGVALSVDGTNWFRLVDLTGNNSTNTYQTQTINLSEFAANNGLTLGAGVQIKFQQFNDTPSPTDGFAFDNISLTGTSTSPDGGPDNDFLKGTSDDDTINGNGGDDLILGAPGNDLLNGGTGDDRLFGDEGNDTLFGASGADFLKGSLGDDLLSGGEEGDTLLGDSGKDTLLGDGGDDFLDGGADADLMFGGSGSDIFVLAAEEGADTILDFADGQDLLGLARGLTFADLEIAAVGSNTLISIAASDELLVTLIGVESSAIAQTDFALL
jgi:Ca2+-binding RTX toxin-like protein